MSALTHAGQDYSSWGQTTLGYTMYFLLGVLVINTAISAVYYIKVMKVMILDKTVEEVEGRPSPPIPITVGPAFYGVLLAAMVFVIGIAWYGLAVASDTAGLDSFHTVRPRDRLVGADASTPRPPRQGRR